MKKAIKWILSAFIGIVCSFTIALLSEGVHALITCGITAFAIAGILYYIILENSDMKLLISIVAFIVVFVLYLLLYGYINNSGDWDWFSFIVMFGPYILTSYVLFADQPNTDQKDSNSNDKV